MTCLVLLVTCVVVSVTCFVVSVTCFGLVVTCFVVFGTAAFTPFRGSKLTLVLRDSFLGLSLSVSLIHSLSLSLSLSPSLHARRDCQEDTCDVCLCVFVCSVCDVCLCVCVCSVFRRGQGSHPAKN